MRHRIGIPPAHQAGIVLPELSHLGISAAINLIVVMLTVVAPLKALELHIRH